MIYLISSSINVNENSSSITNESRIDQITTDNDNFERNYVNNNKNYNNITKCTRAFLLKEVIL
jgi:hypothetical protein